MSSIVPAGQRAAASAGRKLNYNLVPLLQSSLDQVLKSLKEIFPHGFVKKSTTLLHYPRILITGSKGQGHTSHFAPAILHAMERVPTFKLDLPTLFSNSARVPEESCAQVRE